MRQDRLIEQATIQLVRLIDSDAASITVTELARQLRERGITIVCTPVAITLDTGAAEPESEPTPTEQPSGQFVLPIPQPRRAAKSPHQNHPANVNDFGVG
ncbi:hypothetical protein ACIA5C_48410 [Actinoplanes sp. NPDC051343]|uniref:hypothetical protein n=1 Tax=Actinoplanes sp. NPDC051343 TaxID=3363906 RepID=UPI003789995C